LSKVDKTMVARPAAQVRLCALGPGAEKVPGAGQMRPMRRKGMLFTGCRAPALGNIAIESAQAVREETAAKRIRPRRTRTIEPAPPHRVNATLLRPLPVPVAVRAARIR
jgi:hypothetical protein